MRRAALAALVAIAGCTAAPHQPVAVAHHPTTAQSSITATHHVGLVVTRLASLPHGLSRTVAVFTGSRILLLGGLVPGDVTTDEVLALDPSTGRVDVVGHLFQRAHDASGAYLDGRALVFGGGASTGLSAVQAYTGGTSSRAVGHLGAPRSDSGAAVVSGVAYVVGGFSGSVMDHTIDATSDGASVHAAGTLALGVRYPAVAATGGDVWIVGGQLATTESTRSGGQTSDIQRYDPSTQTTTVVGHLPVPLGHATAFAIGGFVYVAGGRTGDVASSRIWRIDPVTGRASIAGHLPVACSDMAAVVIGSTAYLIGGESSGPLAPLRTVFAVRISS